MRCNFRESVTRRRDALVPLDRSTVGIKHDAIISRRYIIYVNGRPVRANSHVRANSTARCVVFELSKPRRDSTDRYSRRRIRCFFYLAPHRRLSRDYRALEFYIPLAALRRRPRGKCARETFSASLGRIIDDRGRIFAERGKAEERGAS